MKPYVSRKKCDEALDEISRIMAEVDSKHKNSLILKDLLTDSELVMLVRRIHIAYLLSQGANFTDIKKMLGAGDSTIHSVKKQMREKGEGYDLIIRILDKKIGESSKRFRSQQVKRDLSSKSYGTPDHFRKYYGNQFPLFADIIDLLYEL